MHSDLNLPKDFPTDSDIDIIKRIAKKSKKTPNDVELLKSTLLQFNYLSKLLKDLPEEYQTKFCQDVKYQYNPAYDTIIKYGDCLVYLYILIKGKAVKLIEPPSNILYKKKKKQNDEILKEATYQTFHKVKNPHLYKKTSKNSEVERICLIKNITENYLQEHQLDNTKKTQQTESKTDILTNQYQNAYHHGILMKNIHPGLRKDPIIRKIVFHNWKSELIPSEDDQNESNFVSEYEDLYNDKNYRIIEVGDRRVFVPYEQTNDYLSLFNYLYADMIISHVLIPGDHFGEHSFMFGNENKKALIAIEDCHLLLIRYGTYRKIFVDHFEKVYTNRIKILDNVPLFNDQAYFKTYLLSRDWGVRRYPINAYVYKEGDFVDKAYIILNGEIEITRIAEKSSQSLGYFPENMRVKSSLKNLNCIWNKGLEKAVKQRVKLACLGPHQIFGDSEIIGPSVSNFRTSSATVISEFAEIYEIQGEILISLFSKKEVKSKKVEGFLKENWRATLEARSIKTHQEIHKQLNDMQIRSEIALNNQNKRSDYDIAKYEQLIGEFLEPGTKKDDEEIVRSKNVKPNTRANLELLIKLEKHLEKDPWPKKRYIIDIKDKSKKEIDISSKSPSKWRKFSGVLEINTSNNGKNDKLFDNQQIPYLMRKSTIDKIKTSRTSISQSNLFMIRGSHSTIKTTTTIDKKDHIGSTIPMGKTIYSESPGYKNLIIETQTPTLEDIIQVPQDSPTLIKARKNDTASSRLSFSNGENSILFVSSQRFLGKMMNSTLWSDKSPSSFGERFFKLRKESISSQAIEPAVVNLLSSPQQQLSDRMNFTPGQSLILDLKSKLHEYNNKNKINSSNNNEIIVISKPINITKCKTDYEIDLQGLSSKKFFPSSEPGSK